jgi:hypothetical protein
MAKLPQQRPTAANILAELGDPELVSGWDVRGRTERVPWLADSSRAARLGSAADGSPRWSGSTAAAVLAPDDTVGPGTPSGATAANAGQQDGAPRLSPYFSQVHAGARPRARRRRRLLIALATAAVMTVALVVAHVQLGPGNEGHAPADTGAVIPGPPALAGVYSGSQYGFSTPNSIAADGSRVWVLNGGNDSVTELDARTGAWMRALKGAPYGISHAADGHQVWSVPLTVYSSQQVPTGDSIAYADGHLWVANGKSLAELNAGNGKLIRVLSGRRYNFTRPSVIAVAGAYVFVAGLGGNSVTVINARTGALAYTLTAARYHFDSLAGISVAGNRVWLLNSPSGTPSSVVELTVGAG